MTDDRPIRADYESQTIRITDHAVTDDWITHKVFSNCQIVGPAVLYPRNCVFSGCSFDVANNDLNSILFEFGERWVVGVIGLESVEFYNCRFTRIGLAVDEAMADAMRREVGPR